MDNVELVAGEMRLWTDYDNDRRPPAGGPALVALLEAVRRDGRTLVLGPHTDEVLGLLPGATVLVRALSDAERIAAGHPDLQVVCGDLVEMTGSFDLVVALDGVERLGSNDRDPLPFADRARHVAGLLADGGRLLLGVDNDASLLALADDRPVSEHRDTGDWEPPPAADETRPAGPAQATAALGDLASTCFAAAWLPTSPTALVDVTASADDVRVRAVLADLGALASYSLLFDPAAALGNALRAGRFADVAGGWVLVAARGDLPALPAAILDTGADTAAALSADDLASAPGTQSVLERALTCAQREDLAGLRALIRDYLPWVAKEPAVRRPEEVVVTEGGFVVLPGVPVAASVDPAAAACVWLARRLLAPDVRRIWPPWLAEADVARSLGAMAELALDPAAVEDAATALPTGPEVVAEDVRTLRALNAQLRQELVAARGEVFAHERLATTRDRQLERRSVNVAKAEARAEAAERRARELEEEIRRIDMAVTRRAGRALKDPKKVARKVKQRLKPE